MASTDGDIWNLYDRLAGLRGHTSVADFDRHQKAFGITWCNHGVLGDADLRHHVGPVSSLTYDWQHTFLSNGIASQEVLNFLGACKGIGIRNIYGLLEQYCQAAWEYPFQHRGAGRMIHKIFCKSREKTSHDHWRSGASELLSCYPFLRRFAESIVAVQYPALQNEVRSLLCCCRVLDHLQDAKGGVNDAPTLAQHVRTALDQHKLAYGSDDWRPKQHYALHIPQQIVRDGMLYDCFVVERSHQLPKLVAEAVNFTGSFEKSVIGRALLHRLQALDAWDEREGLRSEKRSCPDLAAELGVDEVTLASSGQISGMLHNIGDLLLISDTMISMVAIMQPVDDFGILGSACDLVQRISPSCSLRNLQVGLSFMWLGDMRVRRAHAWSKQESGEVLVLVPDLS